MGGRRVVALVCSLNPSHQLFFFSSFLAPSLTFGPEASEARIQGGKGRPDQEPRDDLVCVGVG